MLHRKVIFRNRATIYYCCSKGRKGECSPLHLREDLALEAVKNSLISHISSVVELEQRLNSIVNNSYQKTNCDMSWVEKFRQYSGFIDIDKSMLLTLIDDIFFHDDRHIEIIFKNWTEYQKIVSACGDFENAAKTIGENHDNNCILIEQKRSKSPNRRKSPNNGVLYKRRNDTSRLLSGIIRCKKCGKYMYPCKTKVNGQETSYYYCFKSKNNKCTPHGFREDWALEIVKTSLISYISSVLKLEKRVKSIVNNSPKNLNCDILWIEKFRQYNGFIDMDKTMLLALIDDIFVYYDLTVREHKSIDIIFKNSDEYHNTLLFCEKFE